MDVDGSRNPPASTPASAPVVAPDGKSVRAAELEELRRQQISSGNAQKLDAAAGTPVNLLDWQLQQRALKEQDRTRKSQAEATLHSYRGQDDVKNNLSQIKQEDRRNKQDAERLLRSYRAQNVPESGKKLKDKAGVLHPEEGAGEIESAEDRESVANLAAAFENSGGVPSEEAKQPVSQSKGIAPAPDSPQGSSDSSAVMVESPTQPRPETGITNNSKLETSTDEWISVETSDAPAEEIVKVVEERTMVPDATVVSEEVPVNAPASDSNESKATEAVVDMETEPKLVSESDTVFPAQIVPAALDAPPAEPARVDVDFFFSLLTAEDFPNTTKYMQAVAEILNSSFSNSTDGVSCDPAVLPFVKNVQEDTTFVSPSNVKRCTVYAVVPVFVAASSVVTESAVARVRQVLRRAIEDGSFLEIAKRH